MKRKFGVDDHDDDALYVAPALESTMLIDSGNGVTQNDCIGKVDTIAINASLSSGASLFQYNRFYWNKDLFTNNYSNCAVFIAIAFYSGEVTTQLHFCFYPIYLPRSSYTTFQSLLNGTVTSDPATKALLVKDLLYYLNGAFTGFNYDTYNPVWPVPAIVPPIAPLQGGPTLYSSELKGYLRTPCVNNPSFPIFQTTKEPPLKFILCSSSQQIALIKNPTFWDDEELDLEKGASIAFQLVNPELIFVQGLNNPNASFQMATGTVLPNNFIDITFPSVYNNSAASGNTFAQKGWPSQGIYMSGFGEQMIDPNNLNQYCDVYGTYEKRVELFSKTRWPESVNPISLLTTTAFEIWAKENLLSLDIIVANKVCSLLPSRFITIQSEVLTRDQKLMPLSNNPVIGKSNILGIEYLTLDTIRTKVDTTMAGQSSNASSVNASSLLNRPATTRVVGANDTPVIHFNPSYSIQSIDIYIIDEFGCFLQNYRSPSGYHLEYHADFLNMSQDFAKYSGNFFAMMDGEEAGIGVGGSNGIFTIPPWLAALNPNTALGNTCPLIGPFSTYFVHPFYGIYANNHLLGNNSVPSVSISSDFCPSIPQSANIIHFGRVLGN